MNGITWIILGIIAVCFSAFAIPYGFHLISKEQNQRSEALLMNTGTSIENIQQNFDAITQIKSAFYKFQLGFTKDQFIEKIKKDLKFRNSLTGSLIRLLGLRNELILYNFDQRFFDLIDTDLVPLYKKQNGSYTFNVGSMDEFVKFIKKLLSLVNSIEKNLLEKRNNLFSDLLDKSSNNTNIKQILLNVIQKFRGQVFA